MEAKSALYAAVGAPVVVVRKLGDGVGAGVTNFKTRVGEEKAGYSERAQKAIEGWAAEGERIVSKVGDNKIVGDIGSKVDLDRAKEQVGKLRDQLEEMLDTWKTSFRPEKADAAAVGAPEAVVDATAAEVDATAAEEE